MCELSRDAYDDVLAAELPLGMKLPSLTPYTTPRNSIFSVMTDGMKGCLIYLAPVVPMFDNKDLRNLKRWQASGQAGG